MPTTKEEIANRASLKVRGGTITTFNDNTPQANQVKQIYESFVKNLLTSGKWSFATKKQELTKLNETPINQWKYSYALPSDLLKLDKVWDSSSYNILSVNDFELFETRKLYSNYSELWADYIYRIDESYWPYAFVEFVISALASELAIPLAGDTSLAQYYNVQAFGTPSENGQGGLYAQAAYQDSSQNPNPILRLDYITSSRFSGGSGFYSSYYH